MLPIYELIKNELSESESKTDLTATEKQQLVTDINTMDKAGTELIYAILRTYEHEHGGNNTLPFNGKIQKAGIRFELEPLPILLKRILFKFVAKHKSVTAEV